MKSANSIELKLLRARVQLLFKQPFFATLCLRLKLIPGTVPTMATNGKVIYYNSAFVESITQEELEGVLAHEVLHCALAHHCRRGQRKKRLWNIAADYAINPVVLKNGFVLPAGALINPEYEDLCAEQIYDRLLQEGSGGSSQSAPQASASSSGSATPDSQPHAGPSPGGNSAAPTSKTTPASNSNRPPPPASPPQILEKQE